MTSVELMPDTYCHMYAACQKTQRLRLPLFAASSKVQLSWSTAFVFMENSSSFSLHSAASICGSGGGGRGLGMRNDRSRGRGRGGSGADKIDALGRILTRILRHRATELNLNMRSDGYVKVQDLLKLNLKTFAQIPLCSHTLDDVKEAVRKDDKQRFSLLEENRELFIRANQGHSVKMVETESLLKPILSADEVPVCVHGTYKKNLGSILDSGLNCMNRLHIHFSSGLPTAGEVISGMRRDVDVLIFLDVRKALAEAKLSPLLYSSFWVSLSYFPLPQNSRGDEALHVGQQGDLD